MNLYKNNHPKFFWRILEEIPEDTWQAAISQAKTLLDFAGETNDIDSILELVLGEGQFGKNHWELGFSKRLYYFIKPLIPRSMIKLMRRLYGSPDEHKHKISWPIESRYALFLWEVLRQLIISNNNQPLSFISLWPDKYQYAFVLSHDIETASGQSFVRNIADFEERLGFRSSFNFVLERYPLDFGLMDELRTRGFEVGCHGLKHDGKLFNSKSGFGKRVEIINARMKEYGMVGFRSPLTHRNPEWMQILDIEYDASFFDTDLYEPIPGGVMSIWPYFLGRFVELPYTCIQDNTLAAVLGETTPRMWLEKVDFINKYHGMALLNTHPDYLKNADLLRIYGEFLETMKTRENYWHALPSEVARWWRRRFVSSNNNAVLPLPTATAVMNDNNELVIN
jgi:peptidoglycan/xylan/chitin deacetylase (PgdA/CDA1 family)